MKAGDLEAAKQWRCLLFLPRGVSANEGALLLDALGNQPAKRDEAARLLSREAITWQTTRVRQLLSEAARSTQQPHAMPGRLRERLAEAATLADLPAALATAAGIEKYQSPAKRDTDIAAVAAVEWSRTAAAFSPLRKSIESALPSLLSVSERERRQRLLLKLVMLVPREYGPGGARGKIVVPLEYREAVAFTAQARQLLGELAPLWLAESDAKSDALTRVETHLTTAEDAIGRIAPLDEVSAAMKDAENVLTGDLGVNLTRRGTTADIVDEVMLETRSLLSQSLGAALAGDWKLAEQRRLEAYTTYDPELEARLMPRDPQLATDIEHLLLDGLDLPGVKELLDRRASQADLEAAYGRVNDGLTKAAALLKSGVSPSAAAINAGSVVLREGLEGLLVIIAIFAGLRGAENARRRRLFWVGVTASMAVTALTWLLSQTVMTSLRAHGETIAAITGIVAIATLLLITKLAVPAGLLEAVDHHAEGSGRRGRKHLGARHGWLRGGVSRRAGDGAVSAEPRARCRWDAGRHRGDRRLRGPDRTGFRVAVRRHEAAVLQAAAGDGRPDRAGAGDLHRRYGAGTADGRLAAGPQAHAGVVAGLDRQLAGPLQHVGKHDRPGDRDRPGARHVGRRPVHRQAEEPPAPGREGRVDGRLPGGRGDRSRHALRPRRLCRGLRTRPERRPS